MNQRSAIGFLTNFDIKSAVVNVDIPATKLRRKKLIITDYYDDFLTIINYYNYQN